MMKRIFLPLFLLTVLLFVACSNNDEQISTSNASLPSESITETETSETPVEAESSSVITESTEQIDYDLLHQQAEDMYEYAFCRQPRNDEECTLGDPEDSAYDGHTFWHSLERYCNEIVSLSKIGSEDERNTGFFYTVDELSSYAQVMFSDFDTIPAIPDDIKFVTQEDNGYVISFGNPSDISFELNDIVINTDGTVVMSINMYIYLFIPDYQAVLYSINYYLLVPDMDINNPIGLTIQSTWSELKYDPDSLPSPSPTPLPIDQREYDNWQEAFCDYVLYADENYNPTGYNLIYLDNDDQPELFISGNCEAMGEMILTFSNSRLVTLNLSRIGSTYIDHEGLVLNNCGHMDYYPIMVYLLENGSFEIVAQGLSGWISNDYNPVFDENGQPLYEYFWQGNPVNNEDEYYQKINEVFDVASGTRPSVWYSRDDILSIINSFSPPEVANQ